MTEYSHMIQEGLEVSINALVQSINGMMNREQNLRDKGLFEHADRIHHTIERLYVLRNELILIFNEYKKERSDYV